MTDVTLSIPKELMQNEVMRMIAEKAIGQSIVDAVARSLESYSVKEQVNKALQSVMYEVARKHIEANEQIARLVKKAVDDNLTEKLLHDSVQHVISKLQRSSY
jgi:Fe-S cluster assembly scaffold protein SufB